MATAAYKLTLGPLIDTIFVLEIGGQYANVDELEENLENVYVYENSTRIRIELGGVVQQEWSLKITIEKNGNSYKTVPEVIKGKISSGGGSWFDRTCPLIEI